MKLLYIVLVLSSGLGQILTYEFEDTESRNYLGVFTVVKFANDACQGEDQIWFLTFVKYLTSQAAILPGSDSVWHMRTVTCRVDMVTRKIF